jgi:hypothetical protein
MAGNRERAAPARFSAPPGDTVVLEVGSPLVDGRVYRPHRARVRVHVNSLDTPPAREWTNELTVGDSAGRRVARWVTLGQFDSTGTPGFNLRQTLDHRTLELLGYRLTTRGGVDILLAIAGRRMRGTRKLPNNPEVQQVDQEVPPAGYLASASDLVPLAAGFKAGAIYLAPLWGPNMPAPEGRVFTVYPRETITVEGYHWQAWKVTEHRHHDGRLMATWWLLEEPPYMVAGEVYLENGTVQKMTEIPLP